MIIRFDLVLPYTEALNQGKAYKILIPSKIEILLFSSVSPRSALIPDPTARQKPIM